jgi:hypothetical protein
MLSLEQRSIYATYVCDIIGYRKERKVNFFLGYKKKNLPMKTYIIITSFFPHAIIAQITNST